MLTVHEMKEEQKMRRKVVSFFIALGLTISMSANVVSAGAAEGGIIPAETGEAVEAKAVLPDETELSGEALLDEEATAEKALPDEGDTAKEALPDEELIEEEGFPEEAAEDLAGASDGTGKFSIDAWWAAAKEEAGEADHVIGYDKEIGDIFGYGGLTYSVVNYYKIIQPGETIAILPEVGLNNFGIQGGISAFNFEVWQMEETVPDTSLLKSSTPKKTTLTPLKTKTMQIPYADRAVEHTDDPSRVGDGGLTEVTYVCLYRNDTGLPIVLNGARGGYFDKSMEYGTVYGVNKDNGTNFQGHATKHYKTRLIFAEPYYDVLIDKAAEYGYYYYQRQDVDPAKLFWPKPLSDYSFRLYVDAEDHTFEFPIPIMERRRFHIYESYSNGVFLPNQGQRDGDVYTYTYNLEAATHMERQARIEAYLCDQHIRPVFDGGRTISFDANGGLIGGREKIYFEVDQPDSNVTLTDYVSEEPVYENHVFLGWCTDPENPEGSIVTSAVSERNTHINVYAAWKEILDISRASVAGVSLSYGYSGKAYTPSVTVKVDGTTLTPETDYDITYENNINPGTAKITITGKGNYTGTRIKTFEIVDCVSSIVSGKTYQLIPKNNSKTAVCSFSGKMVNNTKVYITDRSSSEAMRFKAVKNSDGSWKFINVKCELVLAVQQNSSLVGKGLVLYQPTSKAAQNWKLTRKFDNSFAITNAVSGLAVAMSDESAVKGTTLSMDTPASSGLQRFYIAEADPVATPFSGVHAVKASKNKNFAVNIASSQKTDGANVNLYKYSGTNAQKFRFMYSGGGYYRLVNVNSGLVVTVKGNTKTNGANVIQSAWAAQSGQRWKVIENANGTVTLKNALGTVLHLNSNSTANGTNITSRTASTTTAQKWYLG